MAPASSGGKKISCHPTLVLNTVTVSHPGQVRVDPVGWTGWSVRLETCSARAGLSLCKAYPVPQRVPFCVGELSMSYTVCSHLQIEVLSPLQPVLERFKEEYKTLGRALDTTRHELPVQAVHTEGSGQGLLGRHLHGRKEPQGPHVTSYVPQLCVVSEPMFSPVWVGHGQLRDSVPRLLTSQPDGTVGTGRVPELVLRPGP